MESGQNAGLQKLSLERQVIYIRETFYFIFLLVYIL